MSVAFYWKKEESREKEELCSLQGIKTWLRREKTAHLNHLHEGWITKKRKLKCGLRYSYKEENDYNRREKQQKKKSRGDRAPTAMSIVDYIRAIDDGDNVWRENNCGRIKSRLVYNRYEGVRKKFRLISLGEKVEKIYT